MSAVLSAWFASWTIHITPNRSRRADRQNYYANAMSGAILTSAPSRSRLSIDVSEPRASASGTPRTGDETFGLDCSLREWAVIETGTKSFERNRSSVRDFLIAPTPVSVGCPI
jgi:hypothetical protein